MTEFSDEEVKLLWECVESKLSILFERRIQCKSLSQFSEWDDHWSEWDEEDYWKQFRKYKPLWDRLHALTNS